MSSSAASTVSAAAESTGVLGRPRVLVLSDLARVLIISDDAMLFAWHKIQMYGKSSFASKCASIEGGSPVH